MTTTKLAVCFFLLGMAVFAAPVLNPDSMPVADDDPGLGRLILAQPGHIYEVWWNDNPARGDYDFNDLVVEVRFAESATNGFLSAVARVKGRNTAHNLFSYAPGSGEVGADNSPALFIAPLGGEAKFSLYDSNIGKTWWTGGASRNEDNEIHAWVSAIDGKTGRDVPTPEPHTSTPEPQTGFLLASGAGLILLFGRKRIRS